MSDSTRLTDQQITEMLRERVRQPVPEDLRDIVLDEVRSVRRLPRLRRVGGRSRVGLLLVAAVLVVAGSLIVTNAGGPRRTVGPSESPPAVVAPTASEGSVTSSQAQSAAPGIPCPAFDEIARRGGAGTGPDPVPGPASDRPAAGDVITLVSNTEYVDPGVFDPLASSPTPRSISPWNLSSLYLASWNPSADGTVLAPELSGTCDDVFVMRSDGSGLRTPFSVLHRSSFDPAWAPDGSFLAVASAPAPPHVPTIKPVPSFDPEPSTVLVWNPATGSIDDLGRPCETCSPVGWAPGQGIAAWSPDSRRIAVEYTDLSCGIATSEPSSVDECRGIAVITVGADWKRIPIQANGRESQVRLVAWADDQNLIVANGAEFAVLPVESGMLRRLPARVPDTHGAWDTREAISPDHTKAITDGGMNDPTTASDPYIEITDLRSGTATKVQPLPPNWLALVWSPDSNWILVQADWDGFGMNRGLYLVRVDGSVPVRRVLPGAFAPMAWMAAAS